MIIILIITYRNINISNYRDIYEFLSIFIFGDIAHPYILHIYVHTYMNTCVYCI